MSLYGYARVSTVGQDFSLQRAALEAAGCGVIRAETASGTPARRQDRTTAGKARPRQHHQAARDRTGLGVPRVREVATTDVAARFGPVAYFLCGSQHGCWLYPELECRYRRPDGGQIWLYVVAAPLLDAAADLTGAVVGVLDIEAAVQAREEKA